MKMVRHFIKPLTDYNKTTCFISIYYWRIIYKEHKHYRLITTGKYIQKSLKPSREAWLALDR